MRTRWIALMLSLLLALGAAACEGDDAGIEDEGTAPVPGDVPTATE